MYSDRHFDYWKRLQYLNIISLQRRRERLYIILNIWKILQSDQCRHGLKAKVPVTLKHCKLRNQGLYDNSFIVAVTCPRLWNIIPGGRFPQIQNFGNQIYKICSRSTSNDWLRNWQWKLATGLVQKQTRVVTEWDGLLAELENKTK